MNSRDFIEKARKVHGDKYDYSKVEYSNSRTKVCIICPVHGEFWQTPNAHLSGNGCRLCGKENLHKKKEKITTETFIERSKAVHGDKYDYSKTKFEKSSKKVCITCPEHGDFYILPFRHLYGGGCRMCANRSISINKTSTTNEFIEKSVRVHGDKYDYSIVDYRGVKIPVEIICKKHGVFKQTPNDHLSGCGCQKCAIENVWDKRGRITTEEFIRKAKEVHGDKYDYSHVVYKNSRTPVCIICHKKRRDGTEHGEFWQKPNSHLNGEGCKHCRNSQLERNLCIFFNSNGINYVQEKTFDWLVGRGGNHLYYDFYLPDYKVAIECQGIQHFIPIKGNTKKFSEIKENDALKKVLSYNNHIKILYFSEKVICEGYAENKDSLFYDKEELLKSIKG